MREGIQQEGLTRSLEAFSRFLETASFSQAQALNIAAVSRECAISQKAAENYFSILHDLLLAESIPVFTKRAKRRMTKHPKFFFFDTGVYRALRPRGPLDASEEIDGAALETLVFQEMRAVNHYYDFEYEIFFWRTAAGKEVDFVLYGPKGLVALEVKRSGRVNEGMFSGLKAFEQEYPMAKLYFLSAGEKEGWEGNIRIMPVWKFLGNAAKELGGVIFLVNYIYLS